MPVRFAWIAGRVGESMGGTYMVGVGFPAPMFVAVALMNVGLMVATAGVTFVCTMSLPDICLPCVFLACVVFTSGRASHVHFCPRPRSSTEVSNDQANNSPTHTPCSPCSHALQPCYHRMCVTAENLGSPDRLAHAARHGSKRAVSFG